MFNCTPPSLEQPASILFVANQEDAQISLTRRFLASFFNALVEHAPQIRMTMSKFDDEAKKAFPGTVLMLSGCKEDLPPMDKKDLGIEQHELPAISTNLGGYLVPAFLQSLALSKKSWLTVLETTLKNEDGLSNQMPLLSSTRRIKLREKHTDSSSLLWGSTKITGKRRALLIGINYTGKTNQLTGSHDRVREIKSLLIQDLRVPPGNIDVLIDEDGMSFPAKINILQHLKKISQLSQAGDVAFVLFCGHGGRINETEQFLYPVDYSTAGPIREVDLYKNLFCAMRAETRLFCIMDLIK
jgi:hypothetical protein